ncbi:hypothetical protein [Novosphingobium sp.]|uniref:hypothetical protein n=1 Tax=Novosphingobium sp. TaxID=1874826 RepID=UPI002FE0C0B7
MNTDHVSATGDNALVRNAFAMLGQRSGLVSAIVLLCHPASAARASGHLPPIPIPRQEFKDFAACHAFLDETYHADPEAGYLKISYSYRTTKMTCEGRVLTGTHSQGYHTPRMEKPPPEGRLQ